MFEHIEFVTDADGNRTGVIITIEDYEELLVSSEEVVRETNLNSHQDVDPVSRHELTSVLASALSASLDLPETNHTEAN